MQTINHLKRSWEQELRLLDEEIELLSKEQDREQQRVWKGRRDMLASCLEELRGHCPDRPARTGQVSSWTELATSLRE